MKLKFRAEPKDFLIFAIFAVVLLYLVAIGVLNVGAFARDGEFFGFNPFPAFTGEYITATLVFYFVVLATIITSVSSYFFEREKGFGLSTESKADKGYSRWAKDKEMKTHLKLVLPNSESSDAAGVPLINDGKEMWVDNSEFHNLIIGSTGSGKTQIMVHPLVKLLAKHEESMIVTDPKGEIYEENAEYLRSKGYNIVVLNFRDPQKGNAWNPLNLPYTLYKNGNKDKANELLDDLAMNILYDEKAQNQDPFWEKTSADYFVGLSLALFEDAKEEEINLNSINLMSTTGEEKKLGKTYINEYFSHKDPASPTYINVSSTLMAPNDTKQSILSVFKQKIKLFSSRENLSEMLSHNDFDMKEIGRQKTAVFIVIQDEKKTYHSLVTIFIKQCYETLIDVAQEHGGKLPHRTNFILDEFANMPPLKDVTTMVTAARSRNIRFNFIIQNFAQLYQVYGKENGETIKGNCGNIIYLISSELSALEEISKMAGEVKSKEKDKTASTPLVTVSDLQRLKQWETIILRTRMMPFKTKLTPNFKIDWGISFPKSSYPVREKTAISMFNLKQYVDDKQKELFNNASNIMGGNIPNSMFGGMPGFNPTSGMNQNQSMNQNPMFGAQNPFSSSSNTPNPNMNMDDLIKRIDAKIAELEEEERKEKEEAKSKITSKTNDVKEDVVNNLYNTAEFKPIPKPVENIIPDEIDIFDDVPEIIDVETNVTPVQEPIIETTKVSNRDIMEKNDEEIEKLENKNYITDDQFFDDFFSDDEE
ncbi:MAG: type IV secretory system conjugative DNA transfer family protein [Bacilli bacterium]|nr:type IV secretory system conjugative DNA transfer family protein [Bacilli bacterium]